MGRYLLYHSNERMESHNRANFYSNLDLKRAKYSSQVKDIAAYSSSTAKHRIKPKRKYKIKIRHGSSTRQRSSNGRKRAFSSTKPYSKHNQTMYRAKLGDKFVQDYKDLRKINQNDVSFYKIPCIFNHNHHTETYIPNQKHSYSQCFIQCRRP